MLAENLLPAAEEMTAVPCFSRIFPACCFCLDPSFADPQKHLCLQLEKAVSRAFRFAKNISRKQHSGSEAFRIKQKEAECSISCLRPVIPLLFFASTRGFEPPTYRLGGGRSILLSYVDVPVFWLKIKVFRLWNGNHFYDFPLTFCLLTNVSQSSSS